MARNKGLIKLKVTIVGNVVIWRSAKRLKYIAIIMLQLREIS